MLIYGMEVRLYLYYIKNKSRATVTTNYQRTFTSIQNGGTLPINLASLLYICKHFIEQKYTHRLLKTGSS